VLFLFFAEEVMGRIAYLAGFPQGDVHSPMLQSLINRSLFTLLVLSAPLTALAQEVADSAAPSRPAIEQIDAMDLIYRGLNRKRPVSDSAEAQFSIIPGVSFAPQTGFALSAATVMAFRNPKAPRDQKMSNIIAGISYTQYHQIILPVHVVLWSRGNRLNMVLNGRYMRFPSKTWGLGPYTKPSDEYTINFNYLKLHPALLWKVRKNFYAGPVYFYDGYRRTREVNPPPGKVTDFQRYGLVPSEQASGLGLRLLVDSRRSLIKPVNGWFASATMRVNDKGLGSTANWNSLVLEARHYVPFPRNSRNILAFWTYNWLTLGSGRPPYLLLPSNAWDDWHNTARGYVQGRYRGRNMLYLESEYRMEFSRNGLLGGVVFVNTQAYPDNPLKGLSRVLPAIGAGLRLKLNKYSGTNMAFDYGFGVNGSHAVSLNLGEVF